MLSVTTNDPKTTSLKFQSSDPGEIVDYVGRTLAPHRMDVGDSSRMLAKLNSFKIAPAQIVDIQYGTDVWIEPGELQSHFLIHASMQGASEVWVGGVANVISPDNLHISSPGTSFRIHMTPICRHLTVRIGKNAFEDYLSRVLNIPISRPLVFYPGQELGGNLPVAWRSLLAHLISQISLSPSHMANTRTQNHYSLLMIDLLLSNYRNSYSDQISVHGNDVSPWYVRRARDIIHSSFDSPISVASLAARVGVSVRSLQNGFRQFLGLTPVEYVRRHRLENLHCRLTEGRSANRVTELMLECGIMNFGRYAQHYKHQYGCRPSETLRRSTGKEIS